MSPIARVMLGLTTAFCSLIFLLVSRIQNVSSAGFMLILGLGSGVATVLLFLPFFVGKKKGKRKRAEEEYVPQSNSIYEVDLSKISLPGCLLFLGAFTLLIVYVIFIVSSGMMQGAGDDRWKRRIIGMSGFLLIGGFVIGGRFLLQQMGLDVIRKPKKKPQKGKRKRKRRRPRLE